MAPIISLVEGTPHFQTLTPAADAAGRTSSYFSLKNAHRAFAVFHIAQSNAATVALSIVQASAVAGTGTKAINGTHRIWSAPNVATDVRPTQQTSAASFTTDAGLANKMVVIEIDPAVNLDLAGGFDCIAMVTGASNVANLTFGELVIVPRDVRAVTTNPRVD